MSNLKVSASPQPAMSTNPQPVVFAVDDTQRVSGLLQVPPAACACYVMAHGAGAGIGAFVHGELCERSRQSRHRHAALSVRLHGTRLQASGRAATCPRRRPRRSRGGIAPATRSCPVRRRQVLWWPHDFAKRKAYSAVARRPGPGFPGLSAASGGEPSVSCAEHLPTVQIPMLFLQGTRDEFAWICGQ